MGRLTRFLICVAVMAVVAAPLLAQDAVSVKRKAQNKLLARRAARADAIRKLAERIKGLTITSETTVKDFVTESDVINTAMMAFLNGMREKKVTHMEDGTCEVVMEVTLRDVIVNLKQIHQRYYKGSKVKINDFQKMTVTYKDKVLTETGMGAPRPAEWEEGGTMVPVGQGQALASISHMSASAKAFWMRYVTGRGRLMAVRAARVDGLRRLAERIRGVFITSETTVRDFVAESDDVNVSMNTFIRGARETGIRYHDDELIVEVEMSVKLRTVYASLKAWGQAHYRGNKVNIQRLEKLTVRSSDKIISETGMGVPPEKYLKDAPVEVTAVVRTAMNAPAWLSQKLREIGDAAIDTTNDNAAQAKLMAFRAAELDARRKLAERIDGLMITSNTSVRDFVTENDEIQTAMLTFQQGAHEVQGARKILEDGTVQTTVEIDLKPLWNMIIYYQKKLKITIR